MKHTLALTLFLLTVITTEATAERVHTRGYVRRSTGTYVMPHYRTAPDHSRFNNWSSRGNSNPYTGKRGSTVPYRARTRRH